MLFDNIPQRNNILVLLILGFVWGSSFILIKKGLLFLNPLEVACVRVGTGGLVLLPVALSVWRKIEKAYLPKLHISSRFVFAHDDDFMAYPNNYNHHVNMYMNSFQHGGISLEEMIVPFILMDSK